MITVRLGCVTLQVECPEFEALREAIWSIQMMEAHQDRVLRQILDTVERAPRVEFTIGPIQEVV